MSQPDWLNDDEALFALMKSELYTAALCDVMDELGYRDQAMNERIRPIGPPCVAAGRAKTVLAVDVYELDNEHYKLEIESVDSIRPHEIVVACTNGSRRTGFWGELLSTAARARGGVGAVVDGLVRDTRKIVEMNFPVFACGVKPVDSRGRSRVIDYDCPVECGDVLVRPGDIVMADHDGIAVVPAAIAADVVRLALERVRKESLSKKELQVGAYLRDVYNRYGVL